MRLAVALSRENVVRRTGGPFGAAIYERDSGRLVAVGVNSVTRLNNCTLHGEMVAFMMAQAALGSFSLGAPGMPAHELVTSCEPCAMCLGAILWSGVSRVVCGAARTDATERRVGAGAGFPGLYRYLEGGGIQIVHEGLREEARAGVVVHRERGGGIYNGEGLGDGGWGLGNNLRTRFGLRWGG